MAELDYAFIADFARVDSNNTLTAVGASWTFLLADELPAVHRMAVAGRVKATVGEVVNMVINVVGPEESYNIRATGELGGEVPVRPYGEGKVGLLFALDLQVPLPAAGLYEILIDLDGERARRLAFEVALAEAS